LATAAGHRLQKENIPAHQFCCPTIAGRADKML